MKVRVPEIGALVEVTRLTDPSLHAKVDEVYEFDTERGVFRVSLMGSFEEDDSIIAVEGFIQLNLNDEWVLVDPSDATVGGAA